MANIGDLDETAHSVDKPHRDNLYEISNFVLWGLQEKISNGDNLYEK